MALDVVIQHSIYRWIIVAFSHRDIYNASLVLGKGQLKSFRCCNTRMWLQWVCQSVAKKSDYGETNGSCSLPVAAALYSHIYILYVLHAIAFFFFRVPLFAKHKTDTCFICPIALIVADVMTVVECMFRSATIVGDVFLVSYSIKYLNPPYPYNSWLDCRCFAGYMFLYNTSTSNENWIYPGFQHSTETDWLL